MVDRIDVMISSTARDLPVYRKQAIEAILRMSMHPIAMEHLPAKSEDAIDASLAMVDEAEIYLGIFAHRYGYIPDSPKNPDKVSVTELEFRRAVERDIPRLIFVMDESVSVSGADMEKDPDGASKLLRFKKQLTTDYVVGFFNSPEDLREKVITSLAHYRKPDLTNLHSTVALDVPKAPTPYIAHPYTLLQTSQLVGRKRELNLLTDWVAKPSAPVHRARILNVVAIGGMGKSALTWKWFNDIAPEEMKPLAGRLWWSFYESDARFENFVTRALAYVSQTPREEVEKRPLPEREDALLRILNEQPFLLVLDGLERILIAYARMDAAYLRDDALDEETANYIAGAYGLPESAGQSFIGQHRLRKTADPRAGHFLRRLAMVKASRILVSTRLYPTELQTVTGGLAPGSSAIFLPGLTDDDALSLWRAMGVSGSRDRLLPMFHRFENYPLLIRALAGLVANYRRAPGDFDEWRVHHPDFDPLKIPAVQVKSHVLQFALAGLDDKARYVLHTIAAFRMPAGYDTLASLLVGDDSPETLTPNPSPSGRGELTLNPPAPFSLRAKGEEAADGQERFRERASEVMVTLAKQLRQAQTSAEGRLWVCLRDRRLVDFKFRRQHPIPKTNYIVDFFCYACKLVIELDGGIHAFQQADDAVRQQEIEALGYRVLRFKNEQVFDDLQTVLATIAAACLDVQPSSQNLSSPRPEGEGSGVRVFPPLPDADAEGSGVRVFFPTETALDAMLAELEDRGLIGWDKAANRYDLHPIVRGVTWDALTPEGKRGVYENLHAHFEAVPNEFRDWQKVNSLEDLAPAIELYNTLIGLGRYDDAYIVFRDRLEQATHFRLGAYRQRVELLEMLFPDGLDQLPRLSKPGDQAFTLNALALAYQYSGQPGRAAPLYRRVNDIYQEMERDDYLSVGLGNLSYALRLSGGLHDAEAAARRALLITRERNDRFWEAVSLYLLGLALAARGADALTPQPPLPHGEGGKNTADRALRRSLQLFIAQNHTQSEGLVNAYLAQAALWCSDAAAARPLADRAWEIARKREIQGRRNVADLTRSSRLQGEAALGLGDFTAADERLRHALTRARAVNRAEDELLALVALAELARRQGDPAQARERLDEVWELAERGPYPLIHADALNVLAQIERDEAEKVPRPDANAEGFRVRAIEAATRAHEFAWCDGISADGGTCYAYWRGLQKAKAHLEALGASLPNLPPFDESQHDPLPEIDWDEVLNDDVE